MTTRPTLADLWSAGRVLRRALSRNERPSREAIEFYAHAVLYGLVQPHVTLTTTNDPDTDARRRLLADEVEREISTLLKALYRDECPDGWTAIVDPVVVQLIGLGARISQIKEKFGQLRIHIADSPDAHAEQITALIDDAETRCSTTCQDCGANHAKISTRILGGIATLCASCLHTSWERLTDDLLAVITAAAGAEGLVAQSQLEPLLYDRRDWGLIQIDHLDEVLALLVSAERVIVREVDGERCYAPAMRVPTEKLVNNVVWYIRQCLAREEYPPADTVALYVEARRRGIETGPVRALATNRIAGARRQEIAARIEAEVERMLAETKR